MCSTGNTDLMLIYDYLITAFVFEGSETGIEIIIIYIFDSWSWSVGNVKCSGMTSIIVYLGFLLNRPYQNHVCNIIPLSSWF